jgi:hypothetical protein
MKISELPWNVQINGHGTGDLKNHLCCGIWGLEIGERVATEVKDNNANYIVDVCNIFPELAEALRMLLHDTVNSDLQDKAEMIMCKAYSIMNKNNIKPPRFL